MSECSNMCYISEKTCEHCRKNYIVSEEMYKAKRSNFNSYVVGYLVRNKSDNKIAGILNRTNKFYELAWIDEKTITELYYSFSFIPTATFFAKYIVVIF